MKTPHESEEMYLETILLLGQRLPYVRAVDIVKELGYTKSSVSRAVSLLLAHRYIEYGSPGVICLTEAGRKKAEAVYSKHRIITEVFVKMGADRKLAEENACRIEHVISDELIGYLQAYLDEKKGG